MTLITIFGQRRNWVYEKLNHGQLKNVRKQSKKLKDDYSRGKFYCCTTAPYVINLI